MNAMTAALKEAGTPLPSLKFRIWNWLKDHPEKTADDVRVALGINYALQSFMVQMERAGILKVYSDLTRHTNAMTGARMKIKRYSVNNKEAYEPPPRKTNKKRNEILKPVSSTKELFLVAAPAPTDTFNPELFVQKLTLRQSKVLYTYLHEIFK